jgi:hypothetical protein
MSTIGTRAPPLRLRYGPSRRLLREAESHTVEKVEISPRLIARPRWRRKGPNLDGDDAR